MILIMFNSFPAFGNSFFIDLEYVRSLLIFINLNINVEIKSAIIKPIRIEIIEEFWVLLIK